MKFEKLGTKDIQWLHSVVQSNAYSKEEIINLIVDRFSDKKVDRKKAKKFLRKVDKQITEALGATGDFAFSKKRRSGKSNIFIVTGAQNATAVHRPFWGNMMEYVNFLGAELHVIPYRYKNPSAYTSQEALDKYEWWDDITLDYLNSNREELGPGVMYVGDAKIRPTAVNPMRSFESIAGGFSAIFGHPSVQLQSMPSFPSNPTPVHVTSMTCTVPNYSDTKAGLKGKEAHQYGFVVVEIMSDGCYFIRQVTADRDGTFFDLYYKVSDQTIQEIESCEGFVMGDIHLAQVDHEVLGLTIDYLNKVRPGQTVLHDVFDGISVNHHGRKDPFQAWKNAETGMDCIKREVDELMSFVNDVKSLNLVLVYSNHCVWLDRHLKEVDWRTDIRNAKTFLEYAHILLIDQPEKGLLHYLVDEEFSGDVTTLGPNDSHIVAGWEVGSHGHLGLNGSRGSMATFRKFNVPIIFGHLHGASRYGSAVQVGTYTNMDMGYNVGPTNWAHCGAVVHNNGHVQQLLFRPKPDGSLGFTNILPTN